MKVDLSHNFEVEEILIALKQMHPNKASGPAKLPPLFYQKYWSVVGPTITIVALKALNLGLFPRNFNHTHITLILNKEQPLTVVDYRPISLCNILYKLLSKVLANRLKPLLPKQAYI